MLLAAAGAGASAAAAGMAAMPGTGGAPRHGLLGVLLRIGPGLLIASVLLITAAFALSRRPRAAVPALLAGALLYWGMYAQPSLTLMYASITSATPPGPPSTCGCGTNRPPAVTAGTGRRHQAAPGDWSRRPDGRRARTPPLPRPGCPDDQRPARQRPEPPPPGTSDTSGLYRSSSQATM